MMANNTDEIVSIIGNVYLEPIAALSETLFSRNSSQNEVETSGLENGYSVSLCILAIAWFESWTMRVRYLNPTNKHAAIKQPVDFLKSLYPDFPIYDELMEVFVLRDTLVHNHLWLIQFSWGGAAGMRLHKAQKEPFCGDSKYTRYVDLKKRSTKKLGLNIVPIKVCINDFQIVLRTVWTELKFIRDKDPSHMGIGNPAIKFRGKWISVQQFVTQVGN